MGTSRVARVAGPRPGWRLRLLKSCQAAPQAAILSNFSFLGLGSYILQVCKLCALTYTCRKTRLASSWNADAFRNGAFWRGGNNPEADLL